MPHLAQLNSLYPFSPDTRSDASQGDRNTALHAAFANPREALNEAAILAITDARGTIVAANQKFCDLSGYSQDELIGQNHRLLKSGVHDRAFFQDLYSTISSGHTWRGTLCNRAKAGHLYWVDTTIVPSKNSDGEILGYTAIRFDVTPLQHARQSLWNQAHFDALTGAANRFHFLNRLNDRIQAEDEAPFFVAMLDLDHFKEVNDAGGHSSGDILLNTVAKITAEHLEEGELLGRLGGDEFALLLNADGGTAALDARLRIILQDIHAFRLDDTAAPRSTASVGVAVYPRDGDNSDELMRRADLALYAAKREGGDDWRPFQLAYEACAAYRLDLRTRFFQALANGQIQIYFQPIISLCKASPPSFEALVRWIDDDGTVLRPASFFEILAEEPTAREVGNLALHTVIAQIEEWDREGLNFTTITVNATGPDMRSDAFIGAITDAIEQGRVKPMQLGIEITEGMLLDRQAKRVRESIALLYKLGVRIAFDDFGTGFASLTHLRELPINVVKIDRSFVQSICCNDKDRVIVESLISLSHRLGLHVVAEGVETADQMRLLTEMGCDRIQGFYISDALSANLAKSFLKYSPTCDQTA